MHASNRYQTKIYEQTKKILCAFHKTEFLTNFCMDKTCLMPLCPSCIPDHTQQHYKDHSRPQYMNLNDILQQTKQSCLESIQQFQFYSSRLKQMSDFKKKLVQDIHNQLVQHKQTMYVFIQRLFMKFQQEVYKAVTADYEQQGLYKQDEINELIYKIKGTNNDLYGKVGQIKGDECLAALIMYLGDEKQRFNQLRYKCQSYLSKHQISKIDTYLDQNCLKTQLQNFFENIIQVRKITHSVQLSKLKKYEPINRRTPEKPNRSLSQSRRSKVNIVQNNEKYLTPPKSYIESSNKKQKVIRYQTYN